MDQDQDALERELRRAEQERCRAIEAADWDRVEALLHDDLVFTHVDGKTQRRAEYGEDLRRKPRRIARQGLTIIPFGDVTVMHGAMAYDDAALADRVALQVWVREGGTWVMGACQMTPLDPRWLPTFT